MGPSYSCKSLSSTEPHQIHKGNKWAQCLCMLSVCHTIKGVQKFNLNTVSSKDMYMYNSQPPPPSPPPHPTPHLTLCKYNLTKLSKGTPLLANNQGLWALAAKWLTAGYGCMAGYQLKEAPSVVCCFFFTTILYLHTPSHYKERRKS